MLWRKRQDSTIEKGNPQRRRTSGRHAETLEVPDGLLNPNVERHRQVGPLKGFCKMWKKIYHRTTWKH